jgi:lysylphosphatidylglycerol synthetase-like protein (DUF2156 family)
MPLAAYYALLLVYPLILGVIAKFTLDVSLGHALKSAYWLLVAWVVTYGAAIMLILSLADTTFSQFWNLIFISGGYIGLFIVRTYVFTDQVDLFSKVTESKEAN